MEGVHFAQIDRGDYVEHVPQGLLMNEQGIVIVAGGKIPDELKPPGGTVLSVPPLVLKYPKKLPENMTWELLKAQVKKEALEKLMANFREAWDKAGIPPEGLGGLSGENSEARNQIDQVVAHNIDQEPRTDNWAMKEMNSALDNCAKGNCAECEGTGSFDEFNADKMEI